MILIEPGEGRHQKRLDPLGRHRVEGALVAGRAGDVDHSKLNLGRLGHASNLREVPPGQARVEHPDLPGAGHRLQEQPEAFGVQLGGEHEDAGHVGAGSAEARHDAGFDETFSAPERHDDRGRLRGPAGRPDGGRTHRHNEVHLGLFQRDGEPREAVEMVIGRKHREPDRLAFDVAQIPQRLDQRPPGNFYRCEVADPPDLPGRLCCGGQWRGEGARDRGQEVATIHGRDPTAGCLLTPPAFSPILPAPRS
jgi:hypothetical protein